MPQMDTNDITGHTTYDSDAVSRTGLRFMPDDSSLDMPHESGKFLPKLRSCSTASFLSWLRDSYYPFTWLLEYAADKSVSHSLNNVFVVFTRG